MSSEEPRPQHGGYWLEEGVFYACRNGKIIGEYETEAEARAVFLQLGDVEIDPRDKHPVRRDSSGRFIENKSATAALSKGVRLHRPKPPRNVKPQVEESDSYAPFDRVTRRTTGHGGIHDVTHAATEVARGDLQYAGLLDRPGKTRCGIFFGFGEAGCGGVDGYLDRWGHSFRWFWPPPDSSMWAITCKRCLRALGATATMAQTS